MALKNTASDYTQSNRIFPGDIKILDDTIAVAGLAFVTLAEIAGKGQIIAGVFYPTTRLIQDNSGPRVTIDDEILLTRSFALMNQYNLTPPSTSPVRILKYDPVGFYYVCDFFTPLTFESSFLLQYKNNHIGNINVNIHLLYALFE